MKKISFCPNCLTSASTHSAGTGGGGRAGTRGNMNREGVRTGLTRPLQNQHPPLSRCRRDLWGKALWEAYWQAQQAAAPTRTGGNLASFGL